MPVKYHSFGSVERLMLTELNEKSVLKILYKNKKPLEMLPILTDDRIPTIQKGHLLRILKLLEDSDCATTDGLRYRLTLTGKLSLINWYMLLAVATVIVGLLAWLYPKLAS